MLLFDVMHAQDRTLSSWSSSFVHVQTIRNLLFNCIHLINRIAHHPEGTPFCPAKTLEQICEQHFSQKKEGTFGPPTLAACVYSTQKTHLRQLKNPVRLGNQRVSTGLTEEKCHKLIVKSFNTACRFESVSSVGVSPSALQSNLLEWLGL